MMVKVEQSREWWRVAYTVALSELGRAIGAGDALDVEHALQILPALSEAAQSPELDALRADMERTAERLPAFGLG